MSMYLAPDWREAWVDYDRARPILCIAYDLETMGITIEAISVALFVASATVLPAQAREDVACLGRGKPIARREGSNDYEFFVAPRPKDVEEAVERYDFLHLKRARGLFASEPLTRWWRRCQAAYRVRTILRCSHRAMVLGASSRLEPGVPDFADAARAPAERYAPQSARQCRGRCGSAWLASG